MLPLGVCVFNQPPINAPRVTAYPSYVHEILRHAGMAYETVAAADLARQLAGLKVLVTVGNADLAAATKTALHDWLNAGGAWVNVGGTCGMEDVIGAKAAPPGVGFGLGARNLGEGYLVAAKKDHPAVTHVEKPLHFYNGLTMTPTSADVLAVALDKHGRETGTPVMFERAVGKGRVLTISIDVTGTVVLIQQGFAVTRDGIPAPDGTAPVTDGVLKSSDGAVLDWIFDRDDLPGVPGAKAFLQPAADLWREVLLRSIFHCASKQDVRLAVLWYWPRNLPAVAHLSHDTDNNEAPKGWRLLELLKEADVKSTWCTILPGYPHELMEAIRTAGHELATHFDTMTPGHPFTEAEFDKQIKGLVTLFGPDVPAPVTNKNHYLRWEGDMEFYDWIHARGIRLDQSKGASKTGEAGFNFGTCHTYRPVRFSGETVDVLEMATTTQDLNVFANEALFEPLLHAALKHHGMVHLLFHPAHTSREDVGRALVNSVRKAKAAGLEWWTGRQINDWERARRTVKWDKMDGNGVTLSAGQPIPGATVMWLTPRGDGEVWRWGFHFEIRQVDLNAGTSIRVEFPA